MSYLIDAKLDKHRESSLLRRRYAVNARDSFLNFNINYKSKNYNLINFCSSDYLGIATNIKVKQAFRDAALEYGFGAGASALISGYYNDTQLLEEKFSNLIGTESALFFNSGYHANLAVISSLISREDYVVADKLVHASILDGIKLSNAKLYRYKHNCLDDLTRILELINTSCADRKIYIITESVFSMEGDITPINKIIDIANLYNVKLIIDDAHGFGVIGKNGFGILSNYKIIPKEITATIIPLGKAFGGIGAMVCANQKIIDYLIQFSNTYKYTTALPPAISKASLKSLDILTNNRLHNKITNNIIFFNEYAKHIGVKLNSYDKSAIKTIFVGSNSKVISIQDNLVKKGYFVGAIRPPTVPKGTARLRISISALHTTKDIRYLLELIKEYL